MNIYKIKNENRINSKGIVELPEKGTYRALLYRNWSPLQLFDNLHLVEERYLLAPMIAFLSPTSSGSIPYVELTFSITCKVFFLEWKACCILTVAFVSNYQTPPRPPAIRKHEQRRKKNIHLWRREMRQNPVEGERRECGCID